MTTADNFIPLFPFEGDWDVPAKINGRGGNYLLNIGPMGDRNVPEESMRILDEAGGYVSRNEEAIFATKRLDVYAYEIDWGC